MQDSAGLRCHVFRIIGHKCHILAQCGNVFTPFMLNSEDSRALANEGKRNSLAIPSTADTSCGLVVLLAVVLIAAPSAQHPRSQPRSQ